MSEPSLEEHDIAIIGMAGRFAGANCASLFWNNLRNGIESISFFSNEQLLAAGVDREFILNPNYVKALGFIEDIQSFDADFFKMSENEARVVDPQQRALLECAWHALEHAAYDPTRFNGQIGVYAGVGPNVHMLLNPTLLAELRDPHRYMELVVGNDKDYAANRISYKLGLAGVSCSVQTACSTSLVAVHLGCQSLLTGECDMILAGGAYFPTLSKQGYLFQEGGKTSPDGHVRSFDASAAGTVFGSGVGIVVLKRLSDALRERDSIFAVIKGSAVNNDGSSKVGYTVPSVDGQTAVMMEALAVSGVAPETVSYVELHATGTSIGDSIETLALTKAYATKAPQKDSCAIGSVKPNIGHCSVAGGISGLMKTVLCLTNRELVPTLNFKRLNPNINLSRSQFYVNTELKEWRSPNSPRRAAINATGYGGTNAHIILEEAPVISESPRSTHAQLLILSAHSADSLCIMRKNLADFLSKYPNLNLANIAYTLQVGRKAFLHRLAFVCSDITQAAKTLLSDEGMLTGLPASREDTSKKKTINDLISEITSGKFQVTELSERLESLGRLWISGYDVDWQALHKNGPRRRVALPLYAFAKRCY